MAKAKTTTEVQDGKTYSHEETLVAHIKATGAPLKMVKFHTAIASLIDGTPEFAFYNSLSGNRRNRMAKIWYHPHGILIEQGTRTKILGTAQVADSELV